MLSMIGGLDNRTFVLRARTWVPLSADNQGLKISIAYISTAGWIECDCEKCAERDYTNGSADDQATIRRT